MRPLLVTVGLLVCPAVIVSQQPVPAHLSLADAIALAREHNPAYHQSLNDRSPAAWGARNAYTSLLLPTVTASGGLGYAGPGQQLFLTSNFSQSVATWSSTYAFQLAWTLDGQTLAQPGLKKAQLNAADADVAGALATMVNLVTQQYLTALQARDNAALAATQREHDDEFLKLAQARYDVGRASLIDVRQAQVARGQAAVALLRAQTNVRVEELRLFQQMGVSAPADLASVQLTDTFVVEPPTWKLNELLTMAEAQNPPLKALRERERAAAWGVKAATGSYAPSVSLSAGWSGYTQKFSDLGPSLAAIAAQADTAYKVCQYENTAWLNPTQTALALPCSQLQSAVPGQQQAVRTLNSAYPFSFTPQPFQARLTFTIPLWSNFQQPTQVSQAKAQEADAEEAVRARALGIETEVSQAFLILETAYRAIAIQDTSRTAGREQLQLATERYRVGSGTFFELLDAQVRALQTETDYVNAVYDYHKALAALEAAVGRPLR